MTLNFKVIYNFNVKNTYKHMLFTTKQRRDLILFMKLIAKYILQDYV